MLRNLGRVVGVIFIFLLLISGVQAQEKIPVVGIKSIDGCSIKTAPIALGITDAASFRSEVYFSDCRRVDDQVVCNLLASLVEPLKEDGSTLNIPLRQMNTELEEGAAVCVYFGDKRVNIPNNLKNSLPTSGEVGLLDVEGAIFQYMQVDENLGIGILSCRNNSLVFEGGEGVIEESLKDEQINERFSDLEQRCGVYLGKYLSWEVSPDGETGKMSIRAPEEKEDLKEEFLKIDSLPEINCGIPGDEKFNVCCDPEVVRSIRRIEFLKEFYEIYGLIPGLGVLGDVADVLLDVRAKFFSLLTGVVYTAQDYLGVGEEGDIYVSKDYCRYNSVPVKKVKDSEGKEKFQMYTDLSAESVDLNNCYCRYPVEEFDQLALSDRYVEACDNLLINDQAARAACLQKKCEDGIPTAFGCMDYTFAGFINNFLFRIGLSIAGLFSFLCIIYGAFLIKISQGNAEQVGKAQEMIKNCILGLLFIIFSVFIIDLIFGLLFS